MTDSDNDAFLVSSADENPDWVLDSGSAYHFCRDRKMFSTYAACEGLVRMANNTTNKVVGKGTVRFRMADGSIAAKGGILRISKGNKEMLRGTKTRGLYRLEGNVQTGRDAVRHGSSDIRRKNGQGKQQVHTGTQSKRRDTWRSQSGTRAQGDALRHVRKSDQKRPVQPVQDVHRKVQRKETKSILKSCTSTGATSLKRVSFALDLISGSDLFKCVHKGGEREPRRLAK
ncbi:BTB/POZ domain-containing protein [Actinidia rufa]|uniref:BTB/POZ domain-containing protein n=1 Tax=Actinidia rufa TaxID=165716 RepID=A0A7J0GFY4_9ERIC|nr:BTB/POZ domain-containing protein [Actinidia rufa]